MDTRSIKREITPILKRQGVTKAALFGSVARGEAKKRSDIDILIQYKKRDRKSLLDLVKLQFELEEKLGKKVDLVTYKSLHPLLRDIILKDEKIIYEKRS